MNPHRGREGGTYLLHLKDLHTHSHQEEVKGENMEGKGEGGGQFG